MRTKKGIDVQISEKEWDRLYKSQMLLNDFQSDPMVASHTKFLKRYYKQIKKGIFLDLGCGIAWHSLYFSKRGVKTIGLDISLEGLLKSHVMFKKNNKQGFFIQGDFLHVPLEDSVVSFIYWGMAIEYVRDTQQAVNEAYRVLKKGGVVLVPFPPVSFTTLLYHQLRGGDIPRIAGIREIMEFIHVNMLKGKYMHYGYGQTFTVRDMKTYFKTAGFKDIKVGYFDTYYPLSLLPSPLRPIGWRLINLRPFWPFAYIQATK